MDDGGKPRHRPAFHRPETAVRARARPPRPAHVLTLAGMRSGAGFSLIELLVTLAVAGVVLALGIPSFNKIIAANRLTSATNEFISAFNDARLEAVRRNAVTQFCSNSAASNGSDTLGSACATHAGAAFALDSNGDATLVRQAPALPASLSAAQVAGLRFNPQGFARAAAGGTAPYTGLLAELSSASISTDNYRCIFLTAGSIVTSCSASEACPEFDDAPAACK